MNKVRFKLSGYYHPTPHNFRKLGDALLGISQFAAGYAVVSENKEWTIGFMVIGMIGKALTNFFVEEIDVNTTNDKEQNL